MDTIPSIFEVALAQYGEKEKPGSGTNPDIDRYHKYTGHPEWNEDVSWCSSAMNYCAFMARLERSNNATAKSWMKIGNTVHDMQDARINNLIVLHNGDPNKWQGHVGLYVNHTSTRVWLLGGNQSNMFCIKAYSRKLVRENGIRQLSYHWKDTGPRE